MFWDKLRRDKFKHGSSGYFCLNNFQVLTARVFGWASRLLFTRFISSEVYSNTIFSNHTTIWLYIYIYIYTGCPRRNVPDFGKVFLMLKYTDITQNTYIQSWTVTEIMAREVWNVDSCYTLIDYQIHIKTGRNMWFL